MRALPESLAASLATGTTTLARCWRLRRRDGRVLGFTDHDRDLVFDGVTHAAQSGLEAADTESQLGFAVGGGEVAGALVSASLTEADIAAGLYDGASVETWLVDWSAPSSRLLLDSGVIGEVRRSDNAFTAELRSLAHRLDEPRGRLFRAACAADLGDAACRVDLTAPALRASGAIGATDGRAWLESSALAGRAGGLFTGGRVQFETGAGAGLAVEVRQHAATTRGGALALWQPVAAGIAPGDRFTVTAGCDKDFATCRDRFANSVNFRGFPHMPGNDFLIRRAQTGEPGLDGGSLFR